MKKILLVILILLLAGGAFFYWKYFYQKSTRESTQQQSEILDLAQYQQFDKSYFGFMHPQASYSFVKELGVHWQRPHPGPFIWGDIEKKKGEYDWSETDDYVIKSQSYEVAIMATIWPYADWDQKTCHSKLPNSPRQDFSVLGDYRGKPCDEISYQRFIRSLVERYDGDGENDMSDLKYPIKYWEVINEPEMEGDLLFFKGDDQAKDYLQVLKITSLAIKEADSGAKVLNGGIAALSKNELPFWQTVLGGEGKDHINIITIHSIGGSDDLNLNPLENFMETYNLNQPIWLTEIQFGGPQAEPPIDGGSQKPPISFNILPKVLAQQEPLLPKSQQNLTQDEWSQYLVKIFIQALGRGVKRLFYVGLDNLAPGAESSHLVSCQQSKIKREQEEFDPANCVKQKPFETYQTMIQKIDYFDKVEKLNEGQYKFEKEGKIIYTLWGKGSLPEEISGKVKMADVYGNSQEIEASQINLSDEVIYIEKL